MVIFSNASIVFIEGNYITKELFSYFVVITNMMYILFSFLSIYVIEKKGIDYTKNIGFIIFIFGCAGLFVSTHIDGYNISIYFNNFFRGCFHDRVFIKGGRCFSSS